MHDMHLVWFSAIVAASPCADVLSVARAVGAPRRGLPSPYAILGRYGAPVWTARLLFACIYFFPGVHKIATQGLGWASADNLSLQLRWKWFEWGEVPPFRLDERTPRLLRAGGICALAFELGFPLLLLTRRTRIAAAVAGVAFHLGTEKIFRIPFSSLWLCYPVLFDWPGGRPLPVRLRRRDPAPAARGARGVRRPSSRARWRRGREGRMRAFPFACYPTFQHTSPRARPPICGSSDPCAMDDGTRAEVAHAPATRTASGRRRAGGASGRRLAGVTAPTDRRAPPRVRDRRVEQRGPEAVRASYAPGASTRVLRCFPRSARLCAPVREGAPGGPSSATRRSPPLALTLRALASASASRPRSERDSAPRGAARRPSRASTSARERDGPPTASSRGLAPRRRTPRRAAPRRELLPLALDVADGDVRLAPDVRELLRWPAPAPPSRGT